MKFKLTEQFHLFSSSDKIFRFIWGFVSAKIIEERKSLLTWLKLLVRDKFLQLSPQNYFSAILCLCSIVNKKKISVSIVKDSKFTPEDKRTTKFGHENFFHFLGSQN